MKNYNKIKAVLFDFDDTIAYTSIVSSKNIKKIYFEYFPGKTKKDFIDFKNRLKGLPFSLKLKNISNKNIDILEKRWFIDYQKNFDKCILLDGWIEIFNQLKKRGLKLVIVSNKYEKLLIEMLKYFNIESFFDKIIGEDSFDFYKPNIKLSEILCSNLNLHPQNILFIGNSKVDETFYKNSGFKGFVSNENKERVIFLENFINSLK